MTPHPHRDGYGFRRVADPGRSPGADEGGGGNPVCGGGAPFGPGIGRNGTPGEAIRSRDIAKGLGISEHTVKNHIKAAL